MSLRGRLALGTALMAMALPASVAAQQTASAPESIGEIVVTAEKREERLLDVPQSITAVGADALSKLGATQFRDFANLVPALSFTTSGAGQSQITLRGVTAGVDIGPTVGVYVDDVPYGSSSAFTNAAGLALDVGLFDLNRIEVLRGPQGTLYGASAVGGVLKYVTNSPSLSRFGGMAQGGVSFTRAGGTNYNGAVVLNAPLVTDKVGVRASGFYSREAGYIDNLALGADGIGGNRIYGGRLDVLMQPTEALTIRLGGFLQDIHRNGSNTVDYTLAGQPIDGRLDQRRVQAEPFDQRFRLASGTIGYDFGPVKLTSITSYQTSRSVYTQDASAVYVPVLASLGIDLGAVAFDQTRATDKFTEELRLASGHAGFIEWLVGGFYTHEKSANRQVAVPYALSGAVSPLDLAHVSQPSIYEEVAGFADVTAHLTPRFDVTGGIRYARNDQRFSQDATGLLVALQQAAHSHDDVVTYLANARYRISSHATAYVRFATGYQPGGPNFAGRDPVTGAALAPTTFKAATLNSYEAGFKAETADRSFSIDAAGYHIDWSDVQIATAANGVSVIANAGKARIDGAELTLGARPGAGFTVTGNFAWQDARLADDEPELGGTKGERLPNVPRFTAALNTDFEASPTGIRPTIGATLRFVSDRKASFTNNAGLPQFDLGDYVTADLRAGATIGPVQAQLYVRNLFDSHGRLSASTMFAVAGGPAEVAVLQPRTIGVSATTRF